MEVLPAAKVHGMKDGRGWSVLDDDEIQALALYLMRCVDPDRAKHKLEGTELGIEDIAGKSVNLNDFIGIFTAHIDLTLPWLLAPRTTTALAHQSRLVCVPLQPEV